MHARRAATSPFPRRAFLDRRPRPNARPRSRRLELEASPSKARPSGLRLHTASAFEAARGYAPAARAAVLALAGKPASGVPGAGLSERAARNVVRSCGADVEAILAAAAAAAAGSGSGSNGNAGSLGPQAAKLLAPGSPGAAAARRNWGLLRLAAEAQNIPSAVAAALDAAMVEGEEGAVAGDHSERRAAEAAAASTATELVLLHPSVGARWQRLAPALDAAARAAGGGSPGGLALPHAARFVCPRRGVPIDFVARVYEPASGRLLPGLWLPEEEEEEEQQQQQSSPSPAAAEAPGGKGGGAFDPRDCVAVMVVGAGDLEASPGGKRPPQPSPGAKRRLALWKASGWRVAAVTVEELLGSSGGDGGDDSEAAAAAAALKAALRRAIGLAG